MASQEIAILKQRIEDLTDIIAKMLFAPVNHLESYRQMPVAERNEIVEKYIEEQIKLNL